MLETDDGAANVRSSRDADDDVTAGATAAAAATGDEDANDATNGQNRSHADVVGMCRFYRNVY